MNEVMQEGFGGGYQEGSFTGAKKGAQYSAHSGCYRKVESAYWYAFSSSST
jgi:hypothetical protein